MHRRSPEALRGQRPPSVDAKGMGLEDTVRNAGRTGRGDQGPSHSSEGKRQRLARGCRPRVVGSVAQLGPGPSHSRASGRSLSGELLRLSPARLMCPWSALPCHSRLPSVSLGEGKTEKSDREGLTQGDAVFSLHRLNSPAPDNAQ